MNSSDGTPIGTIVAFAGSYDQEWLRSQGWLCCNGDSLLKEDPKYVKLYLKIGNNYGGDSDYFNLPDFRGRFMRGVDQGAGNDPTAQQRVASNPGGPSGDYPGSLQECMTALSNQFSVAATGKHQHQVPHAPTSDNAYAVVGSHYAIWNSGSGNTDPCDAHSHNIIGGDTETRPVNKYVYFIIKYLDEEGE